LKKPLAMVLLLSAASLLVWSLIQLFELRFEAGDVYPEYSTLRADPLGSMALYESLEKLPGFRVQRDYSTLNQLPAGIDTTYFHVATRASSWQLVPEATFAEIERFAGIGGRFVMTMFPEQERGFKSIEAKPTDPNDKTALNGMTSIKDRWGIDIEIIDLEAGSGNTYVPALVDNVTALPFAQVIDWHSGIVLNLSQPDWQPVYERNGRPVLIERKWGRGSIVIATDSYFLSNESLLKDRDTELLAWLAGPANNIIFDEGRFGIVDRPGVAGLIRKYRLTTSVFTLILAAGLFIWKNAFSLLPAYPDEKTRNYVPGKDAASGFDNLLRRGIPADQLLSTCFQEWKKSAAATTARYAPSRVAQAEAAFEAETTRPRNARNPVLAYETISRILGAKSK
jgi:hypothetical protein